MAAAVCALFAALYTAERRGELARLRALGASARRLALGLLVQAEAPAVIAVVIAYLLAGALLAVRSVRVPVLHWSRWRRRRQHRATACHRQWNETAAAAIT